MKASESAPADRSHPAARRASASSDDTTALLRAVGEGDGHALDRLVPRLYDQLHRLAHRELARLGPGATLCTTGLLHEAYLKLVDGERVDARDRGHFLALAATAMRHIVIDHARKAGTRKRGGDRRRVPLDDRLPAPRNRLERLEELLELDEALRNLERFDDRLRGVVECRFFGGLTVEETAEALAISPRTVDRAWEKAKAWLVREMYET